MHRSLKMDAAKKGKGRQGSKMNIFENGPEMAQKLHFFKLSANFSHGYRRDSGKIFFFLPILTPMSLLKPKSAKYLT